MSARSLVFNPGDTERKPHARELTRAWLTSSRGGKQQVVAAKVTP